MKTGLSDWRAHAESCPNLHLREGCCCALASVTEISLTSFVQPKSLGSKLDVGGVPPISGDPMPHGLCSSPSSQRGSAPHGCCIPCHKSTFIHDRGTENSPHIVVLLGLAPAHHSWISDLPLRSQRTPLLVEMLFAQVWQRYQRDLEHLTLPTRDC